MVKHKENNEFFKYKRYIMCPPKSELFYFLSIPHENKFFILPDHSKKRLSELANAQKRIPSILKYDNI